MFQFFNQVLDGLVVDKDRALAEVNADYSTTSDDIADALLQKAEVPFRIGHHFASALTSYGRSHGLRLGEIPYAEAAGIYQAEAKQALPLDEAEFKETTSAVQMVFGNRGTGGPQLAEVQRMLADGQGRAKSDLDWMKSREDRLAAAESSLDKTVATLASGAGS